MEITFEEIMTDYSPNLINSINLHIQEDQQTESRTNLKRSTPRYSIIKQSKTKRRYWKQQEVVTHYIQGSSIRLTVNFHQKPYRLKKGGGGGDMPYSKCWNKNIYITQTCKKFISDKTTLQKWRRNKNILDIQNNSKGNSSGEKKRAPECNSKK